MTLSDRSPARKAAFEKLADVPEEMLSSVLSFLDSLTVKNEKLPEPPFQSSSLEQSKADTDWNAIDTWDDWFNAMRQLPAIPDELSNLSKQERAEIMQEDLYKEHKKQVLETSVKKSAQEA